MKLIFVRSKKRRRTISARIKGDVLEVRIPFFLSEKKAREVGERFLKKIEKKSVRRDSDKFLEKRAIVLIEKYLKGKIGKFSINWSDRQKSIFGVCNHRRKEIRITSRVKKAPSWVIDYLILHELAHLLEANHGKRFWQIVNQYPKADMAKGFLRGITFQS